MANNTEPLVGAIRCCKTLDDINDIFFRFGITDTVEKYNTIIKAMYNPQMFFSCSDISWDLKLRCALSHFLSMNWKANELFEKLER